jgi:hypothetical protein
MATTMRKEIDVDCETLAGAVEVNAENCRERT